MLTAELMIVAAMTLTPGHAFLAPQGDTWQVWIAAPDAVPRAVTTGVEDKVHLAPDPTTGGVLTITSGGRALFIDPEGRLLDAVDLGSGVDQASLSPDGTLIAYSGPLGIRLRDIESSTDRLLVPSEAFERSPVWGKDGHTVFYTARPDGGPAQLYSIGIDGLETRQITVRPGEHFEPEVAVDGAVYVSTNRGGDYDIWRIDPESYGRSPVAIGPGYDGQPALSQDGRALLWVSNRDGGSAIWHATGDGSRPRRLTTPGQPVRNPVWLPDRPHLPGRIAFLRVTEGIWQPWIVRGDASAPRQLSELSADVSRITVSRDGRRMLLNCGDGSVHVVDLGTGKRNRIELEPGGATDAAISPDGRQVIYSAATLGARDANDIWLADIEDGRGRRLTNRPYMQHFPTWVDVSRFLFLSAGVESKQEIWLAQIGDGPSERIVGEHRYSFDPAVSSAERIVFSSNLEDGYDLWLIESIGAEPSRLTSNPRYDGQPSFSPDGDHVVFVSSRGGTSGLWVLEIRSGSVRRLPIEGQLRLPVWFRNPEAEK